MMNVLRFNTGVWALAILVVMISSCGVEMPLKDGNDAYAYKQYALAAQLLAKDYAKAKDRLEQGKIAFKIAESYNHINKLADASSWYKKASDVFYKGAILKYAYSLKALEQYKEAAEAFKEAGNEEGSAYAFQSQIQSCKAAQKWKDDINYSGIKVASMDLNTPYTEVMNAIDAEGNIWISSDKPQSTGKEKPKKYNWTGLYFFDIYSGNPNSGGLNNVGAPFNTAFNDADICFSPDNTEACFVRAGSKDKKSVFLCKLYLVRKDGDSWSKPEPLEWQGEPEANYVHPAFSKDGKAIYFSSDRSDGFGGYDLWVTQKTKEGTWDTPQNLGQTINTEMNEVYPWVDADTLYFSSDGLTGMGGLDIFKSTIRSFRYTNPVNLKAPINSGADDYNYRIDRKTVKKPGMLYQGYFSSNRDGGKGNDDIYRFEAYPPPPPPVVAIKEGDPNNTPKTKINYQVKLEGLTREKSFQIPGDPNSPAVGFNPVADVKLEFSTNDTSFILLSDKQGNFTVTLKENRDYRIIATKDGFFKGSGLVSTYDLTHDPKSPIIVLKTEITMNRIFVNKEIVLEDIYYDFDKFDIREDAKAPLNRLGNLLKQNPKIKIELSSHTDCRGNDNYNMRLSQKRAESAVAYLESLGISSERMTAKGYGETEPRAECACSKCTETQHQLNRRTSFKVVE